MRIVKIARSRTGYGFTISGQHPCSLNGITAGSSADRAGLKTGDLLITVNGLDVSQSSHDDVVRLVGSSDGVLVLEIAENYNSSDSSDDDLHHVQKPVKYSMRPRSKPLNGADKGNRDLPSQSWVGRNAQSVGQSSFVGHKYGRHQSHKGYTERVLSPLHDAHSRISDKHRIINVGELENDRSVYDNELNYRSPHRQTKHTIITREARLGILNSGKTRSHPFSIQSTASTRLPLRDTANQQEYFEKFSDNEDDDSVRSIDGVQVVIGYAGSVEIPCDPKQPSSRLQSIKNAVYRLRSQKLHTLVVMEVDRDGIRLSDSFGRVVAHYVTERVSFCGICPDDRRFFGIVLGADGADAHTTASKSCHIFMVNTDLSDHRAHSRTATQFGINCTMDLDTNQCLEFPSSAAPVIESIGKLYRRRSDEAAMLEDVLPLAGRGELNSSDSGLGYNRDDVETVGSERVCVVEMPPDQRSIDTKRIVIGQSVHDMSCLNDSFIHNLSAIQPVSGRSHFLEYSTTCTVTESSNRHACSSGTIVTNGYNQCERSVASQLVRQENAFISGCASMANRLSLRATRMDPQGCEISSQSTLSQEALLEQQNSAANLRKSMRQIMYSRRQQAPDDLPGSNLESDVSNVNGVPFSTNHAIHKDSPAPPLPPRQPMLKKNSTDTIVVNSQKSIRLSQSFLVKDIKMTPLVDRKPLCAQSEVAAPTRNCNGHFSSSKPPLPDRRPSHPKFSMRMLPPPPVSTKKVIPERPKSTPPIHDAGMEMIPESTHDSDPGELGSIYNESDVSMSSQSLDPSTDERSDRSRNKEVCIVSLFI